MELGTAGQPPTSHPGEYIQFVKHKFETEDEEKIAWLMKHKKSFSEEKGFPNKFWVWTPPVDKDALLREKMEYIAKLEEENKLLREKSEAKPPKPSSANKSAATVPPQDDGNKTDGNTPPWAAIIGNAQNK